MFNKYSSWKKSNRSRSESAWSLVELMVAITVGIVVLGAVMITFIYVNKSFVIIGNYHDLDQDSRRTLDVLTRDIRSIKNVTSFSSTNITLVDMTGNSISYKWDGSSFIRTFNGADEIMLKDCDYLSMNSYQRNPSANFTFFSANNNIAQTKLIDVEWHCWRPVLGSPLTTESVQTAKIVARNF